MSDDLHDVAVVVTGAGRGLGAALAIGLADRGAKPILCGRAPEALNKVAGQIETRTGRRSTKVTVDLADHRGVEIACEEILRLHPVVDIVINNGATWLERRDTPYSVSEVANVVGSAVSGTFLFTQALLPGLVRSSRPDIVTIGSITGLPNAPLHRASVPFYAAKHAQAGLADGLRHVLAGTPIRSICIHPPDLRDISPLEPAWDRVHEQRKGAAVTNRDVLDAIIFAITRPRHVTIASLVIDSDTGGQTGPDRPPRRAEAQ